ncbi:hypothetical protein [Pseudoalteromonas sp. A601]|nr:hypothetical protein [Pseudoalteromonas sp. A601]
MSRTLEMIDIANLKELSATERAGSRFNECKPTAWQWAKVYVK